MKAKYVNPFTDFGFKKIFGEEASKPLLIDFLNSLLPLQNKIRSLSFKNTEQLGQTEADRKAIYDIYCESETGEKFIVELQKAKQNYFRERTIYYSTFPIREQAEKGEWNYNLKAVFCIGILDFVFDDEDEQERKEVVHVVKLKNGHNKVFYEKLTYIYLEMPNFHKTEADLETRLDQWLYFLKYLEDFQNIPLLFQEEAVFTQAFETAALAKLSPEEMDSYEYSLKVFRDLKNTMDYAIETAAEKAHQEGLEKGLQEGIEKGLQEGRQEGIIEVAKAMKNLGIDTNTISKTTGLSVSHIEKL